MKLFSSDYHHGHKNICAYTDRKLVTNSDNHTEWLIANHNKQATKGSLTYILGDYSFSKDYDQVAEFTKRLNGQKIIIKGNHDQEEILKRLQADNLIVKYALYDSTKIGGKHTCMFHFAISNWDRQSYGSYHLHGHSHGGFQGQGKILDVGLDNAYNLYGEHKLFTEEMIIEYMSKRQTYIADSHRSDKSVE